MLASAPLGGWLPEGQPASPIRPTTATTAHVRKKTVLILITLPLLPPQPSSVAPRSRYDDALECSFNWGYRSKTSSTGRISSRVKSPSVANTTPVLPIVPFSQSDSPSGISTSHLTPRRRAASPPESTGWLDVSVPN